MTTNTAAAVTAPQHAMLVTPSGVVLELRPFDGRLLVDARSDARIPAHRVTRVAAHRETHVRVESALARMGFAPERVHTVAVVDGVLSSADDLSIALAVLGRIDLARRAYAELSLGGDLREASGAFSAKAADGGGSVLLARGPAAAWRAARGEEVLVAATLEEALLDKQDFVAIAHSVSYLGEGTIAPRRFCLRGKRGAGLVLAARQEREKLPEISAQDHGEVLAVQSAAGMLTFDLGQTPRPFRAPHHTASRDALVGKAGRPGEAQLARHGVLLLDEVVEFRMDALEALAAALRDQPVVVIATHYTSDSESDATRARLERALKVLGIATIEER